MKKNEHQIPMTDNDKKIRKAQKSAAKRAKKLAKREAKAKRKQAKNAVLSLHKRPIICPPDKAGRHLIFRLFGYICRTLVVWAAATGLVIFVSAALEFGVSNGFIALVSLVITALVAMALYNRIGTLISLLGTAGGAVWLLLSHPSIFSDLWWSLLSLYNAALARLYKVGYLAYINYQVPVGSSTPSEELLSIGVGILCVLVSVVFALFLVRRVRIIPPAILATTLLVVILTFNVYSNRIASNLGIALVIVSFATVLVMAAYDRLYHVKDEKRYDTRVQLFGDSDRPTLPPEYVAEQEAKKARRAAKANAKKQASKRTRKKPVTVDEELTAYFDSKPKKKSKPKQPQAVVSPAEKKAQKKKRREVRRQVRAVRHYDNVTAQAKAAMGGYVSAAVMLLCFLIIALPALSITGNFNTIDAIDEKMAYARDYVTAVLRGDDAKLDELEYGADKNNFKPHSTDLEQLEFTGKQIFYVESKYNTNYYLRGWIGTGYEDGAWLAVDDETLDAYRAMYDTSESPAEELKYGFYHYMMPELVDDEAYMGENYLSKYKSNLPYGFVNVLVSLRRVNSPSTLTYFPTTFKSSEGLFDYGTVNLSELTYVNYFDGLYTGRSFADNEASHASVTYAQLMTNEHWAKNQAELIAAYNLQKETLLAREGFETNQSGGISSYLTLTREERPDGTTMFSYKYKRGQDNRTWRFYHDTDSVKVDGSFVYVTTPQGTLTLTMYGGKVQSAEYTSPTGSDYQNLVELYDGSMTDAERSALMKYLRDDDAYAQFVYDTYTGTSGSAVIADLANTIVQQAHTEVQEVETIYYEDDPETPEDDAFTDTRYVWVNKPADVSLGMVQDSSSVDAYVQRDLLVRNVIDYLNSELGCTYTITPDLTNVDENLDGVENFLVNTKEGYCVQFASATALILRQLGVPVRYVEGYIASDLTRKGSAASADSYYSGYVKDYEAHSWIEVYFDGVGWVTYETTPAPQYYNDMYGAKGGNTSIPSNPILPDIEKPEPDEQETLPPVGGEETDTTADTAVVDDNSEEVLRGSLIALGVMVALGGLIALIAHIVSSARAAEDRRQSVVSQVLESHFGGNTSEEDRQEMAYTLSDAVTTLLTLYDLAPKSGEFRDEYAERLTSELHTPVDKDKDEDAIPLPDLHKLLDAMAAEEFGHGMSVDEMKLLATFYLYLRRDLRKRLPLLARIHLRYVKHLI